MQCYCEFHAKPVSFFDVFACVNRKKYLIIAVKTVLACTIIHWLLDCLI